MVKLSHRQVWRAGVVWLALLLAGHRFYFQFRAAPVYVGPMLPLTARAQETLIRNAPAHLPAAQRSLVVGSRWEEVKSPPVTRGDLVRIRGRLAWGSWAPYWVETVMVHDADRVTVRTDDDRATWIEFRRQDGAWRIERRVKADTATPPPR